VVLSGVARLALSGEPFQAYRLNDDKIVGGQEFRLNPRLNYIRTLPDGMKTISALSRYNAESGLEPPLKQLIDVRASQINGCAYCIDMHWKEARSGGETEQRLYALSAWRETDFYSERERTALALTEAVTLISNDQVPDEVYNEAKDHFSDEELVKLVHAIVTINAWNRFVITFRTQPGSFQPNHFVTKAPQTVATAGD
jgi:AhpD family alkylhydroperoxidase